MNMIFPGMDPYLEDPKIWKGLHSRLIVYLADQLVPRLRPRYVAAVEARVYVEWHNDRTIWPDVVVHRAPATRERGQESAVAVLDADAPETVTMAQREVEEPYVAILDLDNGRDIVAVIEVVSPSNKRPGPGRTSYMAKQSEVFASASHSIEIDLLRRGKHVLFVDERLARMKPYDYLVSVNRAEECRERFELYRRSLRERLPRVRIPLGEGDPDIALDLQSVLAQTYEMGSYRATLPYDKPCAVELTPEDQAWANELIRGQAKAV